MALETPVVNAAVDAATTLLAFASLHSANPGGTGTNELTGGSPAYARKAVVYDPATGGIGALDAALEFDIPSGSTVAYVGFWSAVSGGTWRGSDQLSAAETYTGQGVYRLTAASVTGTAS